ILNVPDGSFQPYALAVVAALLFFGSILLHELGHAVAAIRDGIGISYITLWMFGGVAGLERDSTSAGSEFRIAVAGPVVTLLITIVCVGAGLAIDPSGLIDAVAFDDAAPSGALLVIAWLAQINLIVLAFNLLPAFPLDGGRIARAAAWKLTGDREKATGFAARLGQIFAFIFIAGGVLLVLTTDAFVTGVWIAVIGWMLGQSARATVVRNELNKRIGGLKVADVMDREPVTIPGGTTVEQALDEYFLRYQWPWFPVTDPDRHFLGLLKRGAADGVPEATRSYKQVAELVDDGVAADQQVSEDAPLESLLGNAELRRLGALAAVGERGELRGVISLDQVGRALREAVGDDGNPSLASRG
ncbi:MAG: site-2 protease family protein, partial [Solirubrobacterales bacterium]